tara:strand:- start:8069 stop:10591 length:2523 start_codon:yes stop_codon:yes gene_type:complete
MSAPNPVPLKRGVEVSNKLDPETTLVRVVYTHRPGLHADLTVCVDSQKLRIVRSDLSRAGHLRVHHFWVVDTLSGQKLPHSELTPLSLAVRDTVVDPGVWARWFGLENAKTRATTDAQRENVTGKGVSTSCRILIDASSNPSALRDFSLAALARGVDFDELRCSLDTGVPQERKTNQKFHQKFQLEVSLRCDDKTDVQFVANELSQMINHRSLVPPGLIDAVSSSVSLKASVNGSTSNPSSKLVTSPERGNEGALGSLSSHRSTRGNAMLRAESIADLSRFQIGGTPSNPSSPAPAPVSPAPYQTRSTTSGGDRVNINQLGGMHRSLSVAEMSRAAGDGRASLRAELGSRLGAPASSSAHSSSLKRTGHAIPHASSIADLQAMQNARGQVPLRVHAPYGPDGSPDSASPSGSRSPSRLGRVSNAADAEMMDADGPSSNGYSMENQYSTDGTSVALLDGTFGQILPKASTTLFGEGKFPTLPSPKRDKTELDYKLLRELGRGLCGTVYLAEEISTKRIVAFKVMRKTKLVDVGEATHASEERKLHERISSGPFINRLINSFQDPWALFLVLEYAPCGDLFQAMNFHGLPSRDDARVYAAQVAIALEHLHLLGYVYRDLKPENILLHPHGSAQLADFGMAKRIGGGDGMSTSSMGTTGAQSGNSATPSKTIKSSARTYTICGTAQYMSPEVLLHRGCRFEADLWALGIFIYELVTGDTPFSGISGSRQELYRKLMSHDPTTMAMPSNVDSDTASIVRALLRNDELQRLGADGKWAELFSHKWFGGLNCDLVKKGHITPTLSPRKRNVITDPNLRKVLDRGDAPWRRGALLEDQAVLGLFDRF